MIIDNLHTFALQMRCSACIYTVCIQIMYKIYCSYDKSGYDYWTEIMEESNYTYIDIWISDDFSDDDFNSLIEELDEILRNIDNFLDENLEN